jgi:hypothetical protein
MKPFEFIIVLFSFIYTLALTHLLFAITRMVRHRRELTFSWTHALWMFGVLVLLLENWLSWWDFHKLEVLSLPVIVGGLVICISQYFTCALISPDFEDGDTYDMRAFQEREGRTYITAILALAVIALVTNYAAGADLGILNWANQNAPVALIVPFLLLALFVRAAWAQLLAAVVFAGNNIASVLLYYPVLR